MELGVPKEIVVEALVKFPFIRGRRYTILKDRITRKDAEKLLSNSR